MTKMNSGQAAVKRAVGCAAIFVFSVQGPALTSAANATPLVSFVKVPPARVLLATTVNFEWRGSEVGLEYRYKLTVPGDWKAGVRYLVNRWSDWGAVQSVSFNDFIVAGTYTLSVQARNRRQGALSQPISSLFAVYFQMPELFEDAVSIDWAAARRAPSKKERYQILAREFATAHRAWRQKFEYQLRLLKSTVDPQQFIDTLVPIPVKETATRVLRWADEGLAVRVGALLAPAKIYGLVQQAGIDVILIFRNVEANRAACMVILTEYAQVGFEYLAQQAAVPSGAPAPARAMESRPQSVDMVLVLAGEFWMGSVQDELGSECRNYGFTEIECTTHNRDELPRHRVVLDAFYIDWYEVTNTQFKEFIEAAGYERPDFWSDAGWRWRRRENVTQPRYWTDTTLSNAQHPVVGTSWYEAEAFCRFAGKRLVTEAEWEKAARGTDGRRFPWGKEWDAAMANGGGDIERTVNGQPIVKRGGPTNQATRPVGSYPRAASPYGVYDMAGNVGEWVADWYARDYYRHSPEQNPMGPSTGNEKVIRGGSFYNNPLGLTTTSRDIGLPDVTRSPHVGFRCAR